MDNDAYFSSSIPSSYSRLSLSSSTQRSSASSESPREPFSGLNIYSSSLPDTNDDDDTTLSVKTESLEENGLEDPDPSPATSTQTSPVEGNQPKRGRGRPRKHPIVLPDSEDTKPSKGRSKTGCLTCRKRKKKCDEAKPTCLNCQKNNAICEGYPSREKWQAGKDNRSYGRRKPRGLPVLIHGVENDLDRTLLDHFNYHLSKVLNPWKDEHNPFLDILLPMALRHRGLMHSLLCLSASHLSSRDGNPDIISRYHYHYDLALNTLLTDKNLFTQAGNPDHPIDDPTIAQTLVLCLKSVNAGETDGEYRYHLDAARHLVTTQQSSNPEFQKFIFDLFIFHEISNSITSLNRRSVVLTENFHLPKFIPPEAGTLFGVLDGLFIYISKITNLRDRIRARRSEGLRPLIDYDTLSDAQTVDADLRSWTNSQQKGTQRHLAGHLYHLCTWIYLHRTVLPSGPNASLCDAVDDGISYVKQLSQDDNSAQAILLMPVFLLGCAAFEEYQRPEIKTSFDRLEAYRSSGNIKHTRAVVELVWEMMDRGDEDSWDWETLMDRMKLDFLVT